VTLMATLADEKLLAAAEPEKLPADFPLAGLGAVLGDFWSWAYSDALGNTVRPIFAEFIVASALGITDRPRIEWDAVDLVFNGKRIEVKSSSYLQSWPQKALSKIRFEIGMKQSWHAATGFWETEPIRSADCYVFCLYCEKTHGGRNSRAVLDVARWSFYVVSSEEIGAKFGGQKSVGLGAIQPFGGCEFIQLKSRIEEKLWLR
jgi:hypothetical protein